MILVLIGPPGSGKDTQARILSEKHGLTVVSPGEALREAVEKGGELATEIESYIDQGHLVPDDITDKVMRNYIQNRNVDKGIVFTGYPRREHQVEMMLELMKDLDLQLDSVLYLDLAENEVVRRLSGRLYAPGSDRVYHPEFNPPRVPGVDDDTGEPLVRREDDDPQSIKERLKVFHRYNESLLQKLEQSGIVVHKIDGSQSIEQVAQQVQHVIKTLPQSRRLA